MNREKAFTLVEVALALGLAAFCLVTIFALLPVGQITTEAALNQTGANGIISVIAADLRGTPKGDLQESPQFQLRIPASGGTPAPVTLYFDGEGNFTNSLDDRSHYRATVEFVSPPNNPPTATIALVRVSWPAPATVANSSGKVASLIAIDRN